MDQVIQAWHVIENAWAITGRNTGEEGPIDLPQIVVVGSQSAGKTSIVERIVGIDFLPRGVGIVTRCPLLLQLVHVDKSVKRPAGVDDDSPWATFLDDDCDSNKILTDFEEVRRNVEKETARIAGQGKDVSDKPIRLRIFSPHVASLSIVDLPGIAKNAMNGQPVDIESKIKDICRNYIGKHNSIILAISMAIVDLANCDAINLAAEFDPQRERTLAVITKLDMVDKGVDKARLLQGEEMKFEMGIIGCVNRNQEDLQKGRSLDAAEKYEARFFKSNYAAIAQKHGIPYLTRQLSRILVEKIRENVPSLEKRIAKRISELDTQLAELGYVAGDAKRAPTLLRFIDEYVATFKDNIKGIARGYLIGKKHAGIGLKKIFYETFPASVDIPKALDDLNDSELKEAMEQDAGPNMRIYPSEDVLHNLLKRRIVAFRQPSLECVKWCLDEMNELCYRCTENPLFGQYPALSAKLSEVVANLIAERASPTREMVENLINNEKAFINTGHPMFRKRLNDFEPPASNTSSGNTQSGTQNGGNYWLTRVSSAASLQQAATPATNAATAAPARNTNNNSSLDDELAKTKFLAACYFEIVRGNIKDAVPKAIMNFLVNSVCDTISERLNKELLTLSTDEQESLLQEDKQVIERREALLREQEALEEAKKGILLIKSNGSHHRF